MKLRKLYEDKKESYELQAEEIFADFDCFVGKRGHEKEYAMLKKKWGVK